MMSWFESWLDWHYEAVEISDGCGTDQLAQREVFLKRWFIIRNEFASTPPRSAPIHNLTKVRKEGGMVMVHKFLRSDADRELHDHPWDFKSIILWRGYLEETEVPGQPGNTQLQRKYPGMILRRKATHRHRVHLIDGKPSWSLIFTGDKARSWGFWRDGNFIPWRDFASKRCEHKETM